MQLAIGDALAIALLESRGFTAIDFRNLHPGGRLGAALTFVRDLMHGGAEMPLRPAGTRMSDALVEMSAKAQKMIVLRHNIDTIDRAVPMWLEVTADDFKAVVRDLPLRDQIDVPVREQLIVELYSK